MKPRVFEKLLYLAILCLLPAYLCWAAVHSDADHLPDGLKLENEFAVLLPPSTAVRQGDVKRINAMGAQVISADYSSDMTQRDLEQHYESLLEKNGWKNHAPVLASGSRIHLYCKDDLDAVLKESDDGSGHFYFGLRRQRGTSFKTGCA